MVSAQTEWRSLPNRAWVRDLSTELFVALGPHGLKSTEAALDAIVAVVIKHNTPGTTP